ncbi:coenzyme A pyrophosphatase [Glutamicibacter uratoxydans]|uniref:Coenzyme A pyrophosphatase n=1 Tax=Glutamicibacter uratoxydans TaxID=43667 RepID=A0A4Y4DPK9_GLUUR|nr:CoA pyrophosphatase [Glutamicibacter uratoxydans]GED05308.1 coenzyme A pyrophosphatase [Glutamicibacter uratoxydans]
MSAREELERVISRHKTYAGAPRRLRNDINFAPEDIAGARKAAVLILFGAAGEQRLSETAAPEDLDLLFVQRASTLRKHAGQVSFPGGGIDPEDGSAADAALREAWEETGVQTSGIEVLGSLAETELPVTNFLVTPVLGWWHTESKVYPVDPGESAAVFRAPVAQMLDPRHRLTGVVQRDGRKFKSPAFEVGGHIIWGFTAIVVDQLFTELGWTRQWDDSREIRMN